MVSCVPLWAKLPAASSISNSRLRQVWYVLLPGSISGPSTTTYEFKGNSASPRVAEIVSYCHMIKTS